MLITCNLKIESYQFFKFFYPYKSLFMILMYKYLCYNNVNSVILTQFSCDLLYVFILVQSFTLFVGKIALMANVLICYN